MLTRVVAGPQAPLAHLLLRAWQGVRAVPLLLAALRVVRWLARSLDLPAVPTSDVAWQAAQGGAGRARRRVGRVRGTRQAKPAMRSSVAERRWQDPNTVSNNVLLELKRLGFTAVGPARSALHTR